MQVTSPRLFCVLITNMFILKLQRKIIPTDLHKYVCIYFVWIGNIHIILSNNLFISVLFARGTSLNTCTYQRNRTRRTVLTHVNGFGDGDHVTQCWFFLGLGWLLTLTLAGIGKVSLTGILNTGCQCNVNVALDKLCNAIRNVLPMCVGVKACCMWVKVFDFLPLLTLFSSGHIETWESTM